MNRRGFIQGLAGALAGFAILPAATTYTRLWKAVVIPKINPEWLSAPYEISFVGSGRLFPVWERKPTYDFGTRLKFNPHNGLYEPVPMYV